MRLKRHECPRSLGRSTKGRKGTARARQLRKRTQVIRRILKDAKG